MKNQAAFGFRIVGLMTCCCVLFGFEFRTQETAQRWERVTLVIEFALAFEFTDQSFATQETSDQAAAGFADVELQRVLEGHDVSGIDGVIAVDLHGVDRTVAAQVQFATSRALDPKHRLATKEGR